MFCFLQKGPSALLPVQPYVPWCSPVAPYLPKFVKGALSADAMGGRPRKTYGSVHEALDDVFKPILVTLSDHLTKNGCSELIPLLPKCILFRVMLGMCTNFLVTTKTKGKSEVLLKCGKTR